MTEEDINKAVDELMEKQDLAIRVECLEAFIQKLFRLDYKKTLEECKAQTRAAIKESMMAELERLEKGEDNV